MSVARQYAEVQVFFALVPKEIANRSGLESAYRPTGRPNQDTGPAEARSAGQAIQVANIGPVPLFRL
jgi:hypothetical protein